MEGRQSGRACARPAALPGRPGMARPQCQCRRQAERTAMRWGGLIVLALLVSGRVAFGQSSDPSGTGLQACLQAARVADDDCAKLTDNPTGRIECFQKARAAELDCLDHALSDAATGTTGKGTPSASAGPQPSAEPAPAPSADVVSSTEALKALVPASPP